MINNSNVERVTYFRYLWTHFDNKLNFSVHVNEVIKKFQEGIVLLRKLKSSDVREKIVKLIYVSLLKSVISFNIVTWHNYLKSCQKNKMNKTIIMCNRIVGENSICVNKLYIKLLKERQGIVHQIFNIL